MQSSRDILENIQLVITKSLEQKPEVRVIGIGCDATCSLVLLDKNQSGFEIGRENDEIFDVILWRDHRALIGLYYSIL